MKLKFVLILAVSLLGTAVFAGPPASSPSVAPAPASQAVFVVAPADLPPASAVGVQIDTPKLAPPPAATGKAAIQVWSGPVPLAGGLWLLVASMPVLAILYFAYQLWLFIQARRRRLSHEKH